MNTVVGVMEAPAKLPLTSAGCGGGVNRPYKTRWVQTLDLQLGKWTGTSGRVMDKWDGITREGAKVKESSVTQYYTSTQYSFFSLLDLELVEFILMRQKAGFYLVSIFNTAIEVTCYQKCLQTL